MAFPVDWSHLFAAMAEPFEPVPPFDVNGCRYDQRTYTGRLRRFREMTDPRMLLIGDEELAKVRAALLSHHSARARNH